VSDTPTPPSPEDFSGGAVQRAVLKETLQHPLTILPAAVSVVSLMYMGLISFDPTSFGVAFGAALFGAAAWVVNYFFRGEQFAADHVRRLREQRDAGEEMALTALRSECKAAKFAPGVEAAAQLAGAYEKLRRMLSDRAAAGQPEAARFGVLAEDTYREGMQLLRIALDTHRALQEIDVDRLQKELARWQADLRRLEPRARSDDAAASGRATLEAQIAGHQKRLASYTEHEAALQRNLAQCEALESALETAYLEVLDLGQEKDQLLQGEAASRLEQAVSAARAVEDRLRNGRVNSDADAIYLQQGKQSARTRT